MISKTYIALGVVTTLTFVSGVDLYRVHAIGKFRGRSPGGNYTFCFPAPQMQGRVAAYRKLFLQSYLVPQNPYSMFEAMTQANIEPTSVDDEKKIGARGPFVFSSPSTLTNDASRLNICTPGPVCDSGDFPVSLAAGNYIVRADLPPVINVQITNGPALLFDFGAGIPIHINNPGATPVPVVRQDMNLKSVSLSDSALQEVVTSPATANDGAMTVIINLDLVNGCNATGHGGSGK